MSFARVRRNARGALSEAADAAPVVIAAAQFEPGRAAPGRLVISTFRLSALIGRIFNNVCDKNGFFEGWRCVLGLANWLVHPRLTYYFTEDCASIVFVQEISNSKISGMKRIFILLKLYFVIIVQCRFV